MRRLLAAVVGATLTATLGATVSLPGAASAAPAEPSPSARYGTDYYYGAAGAYAETPAAGFQATLTVQKPQQVQRKGRHHSLGQIAVGQRKDGSYLEAGWTQERGKPRLFVFWRPASGKKTCYDLGCGFRLKGPGKAPGSRLKVGSTVTVGYQHIGRKWWFLVNGKKSGYYPDRLWKGGFTSTDLGQVFGEVSVGRGTAPCTDMGTGQLPSTGQAATISGVAWIGGPPSLQLITTPSTYPTWYDVALTAPNAIAYGGPGAC